MPAAPAALASLIAFLVGIAALAAAPACARTTLMDLAAKTNLPAQTDLSAPAPVPAAAAADSGGLSTAYFAGGPFWALEAAFESQDGVQAAIVGYMGGAEANPAYDAVIEGGTGHFLVVAVRYDARRVAYGKLADIYWRHVDPLGRDRQFLDSGYQFRTALLYRDSAQKREALASRERARRRGRFTDSLAVAVEPAGAFLRAEEAQQDYHRKHPGRYRAWLKFSGREAALRRIWDPKARGRDPSALPPGGRKPAGEDPVGEKASAGTVPAGKDPAGKAPPRPPHSATDSP